MMWGRTRRRKNLRTQIFRLDGDPPILTDFWVPFSNILILAKPAFFLSSAVWSHYHTVCFRKSYVDRSAAPPHFCPPPCGVFEHEKKNTFCPRRCVTLSNFCALKYPVSKKHCILPRRHLDREFGCLFSVRGLQKIDIVHLRILCIFGFLVK